MFLKYANAIKYLEKIPDFLSMYGVFTSQSTSQIRQEMSIGRASDSESRGPWFDHHKGHLVVSLSKTHKLPKVLVNTPDRKRWLRPEV